MSQSENSMNSTRTVPPYIMASEEEEDSTEEEITEGAPGAVVEYPPTLIAYEELAFLIQRLSEAIECGNQVLSLLVEVYRRNSH